MSSNSTPTTSISRPSFTPHSTSYSAHQAHQSQPLTPIQSPQHSFASLNRSIRPDPQRHGHIPNVKPGMIWPNRMAVSQAGVHAPVQAGISGHVDRGGAESVVLNGGYPYGDGGDIIWYVGAGGHTNPWTNKKSSMMQCDQTLSNTGNKAMAKSLRSRLPVRVIRGPHADDSPWAPTQGYRYDGLYRVTHQTLTLDPSHRTQYECYVWRMERILEADLPYQIPIRPGERDTAKQRARLGRQKKFREEQEQASSQDAHQSVKRPSGFSCPGKSKRLKREESSSTFKPKDPPSTLPIHKNSDFNRSDFSTSSKNQTQPVPSTSNHRPNLSSKPQVKHTTSQDPNKGQIPNNMMGWNGLDGDKVGNVLSKLSFRKKPTLTTNPQSNTSHSKPDEIILPNIAKSSVNTSSSPQAIIQDRAGSDSHPSKHSRTLTTDRDRTTDTSTSMNRKKSNEISEPSAQPIGQLDTAASTSTHINRERTPESGISQDEHRLFTSPPALSMNLGLASPIRLGSPSSEHSLPALKPSSYYDINEDEEEDEEDENHESYSRNSSPIEDGEGHHEDLQMMWEEEEEELIELSRTGGGDEKTNTPLFRDALMNEEEEEGSLEEIFKDTSDLSIGSSTDLMIRPIQAHPAPEEIVLGVMMTRIKDPADGCLVLYDSNKGKYMVGEYELEDDEDELEEMESRIGIKEEEEEDTGLLEL
ncbi:hypothetical protein DFH28DRAFT_943472, partial [Melampsora americana]